MATTERPGTPRPMQAPDSGHTQNRIRAHRVPDPVFLSGRLPGPMAAPWRPHDGPMITR